MNRDDKHLCPSSSAKEGALLLGVVNGNQSVSFLPTPFPVTQQFIDNAKLEGGLENRFRFTNRCTKHGCGQWTNGQCGVINRLAEANAHLDNEAGIQLKPCAIRQSCRWYAQEGSKACQICPFVITEEIGQEEDRVMYAY